MALMMTGQTWTDPCLELLYELRMIEYFVRVKPAAPPMESKSFLEVEGLWERCTPLSSVPTSSAELTGLSGHGPLPALACQPEPASLLTTQERTHDHASRCRWS